MRNTYIFSLEGHAIDDKVREGGQLIIGVERRSIGHDAKIAHEWEESDGAAGVARVVATHGRHRAKRTGAPTLRGRSGMKARIAARRSA